MAKKTSSTKPVLPTTYESLSLEVERKIAEVNALIESARTVVTKLVLDHFESHGGCEKCHGRGWVVVWDTLDSLSGCYAEYGSCPNPDCTPESRAASGVKPHGHSVYDKNRGVKDPVETHDAWFVLTKNLIEHRRDLDLVLADYAARRGTMKYMDECVVVRGRKIPIGFRGRVCWMGTGEWGSRVGLQTADGTKVYTARSNVEKVA